MLITLQMLIYFRESLLNALDRILRPYYNKFSLTFGRSGDISDDEESDEQVFAEFDDEKGVVFYPPVYLQRYAAVSDCLMDEQWCGKLDKVVDLGYHNISFIKYLKEVSGIKCILGVDIESIPLRCSSDLVGCDYGPKRESPLRVTLFQGNAADPDYRLIGCDAVVGIEIIEHMLPQDLERLVHTVFGFVKPWVAIFTTPNGDFNVLFKVLEKNGLRRLDHFFEWSREQFHDWCSNIVTRYPDYTVSCKGLGPGPPGTLHLGCCSQMAVFTSTNYHKQQDLNIDSLALVANAPNPYNVSELIGTWDSAEAPNECNMICPPNNVESYTELYTERQSCVSILLASQFDNYSQSNIDTDTLLRRTVISLAAFAQHDKTSQCDLDTEAARSYMMFDYEEMCLDVVVPRRKVENRVYTIEDVNSRLNCTTLQVNKFSKTTQNLIAKNKVDSLVHTREVVDEIRHLTKMLNFNKDHQPLENGVHIWHNINWGDNAPYWNQYYTLVREYNPPYESKSEESRIIELISDAINLLIDNQFEEDFSVDMNRLEIPIEHLMSVVAHITSDVERVIEVLEWNGYEIVDNVVIHSRLVVDNTSTLDTQDEDWPDIDTYSDWDSTEIHSTSFSDGSTLAPEYHAARCLRRALDHKVRKLRTMLTADADITTELDRVVCKLMKLALRSSRERRSPPPTRWMQCKLLDLLTLTEKAIERRKRYFIENYPLKSIGYDDSSEKSQEMLALKKIKEDTTALKIVDKYRHLVQTENTGVIEDSRATYHFIDLELEDDLSATSAHFLKDYEYIDRHSPSLYEPEPTLTDMALFDPDDERTKLERTQAWLEDDLEVVSYPDHDLNFDNDISSGDTDHSTKLTRYYKKSFKKYKMKKQSIELKCVICKRSHSKVIERKDKKVKDKTSKTKVIKKASKNKSSYNNLFKDTRNKFGSVDYRHYRVKRSKNEYKSTQPTASKPIPTSLIELCHPELMIEDNLETYNEHIINFTRDDMLQFNQTSGGVAATEKSHLIDIVMDDTKETIAMKRTIGTDAEEDPMEIETMIRSVSNAFMNDHFYDKHDVGIENDQTIFLNDINEPSTSKGIRHVSMDVQCGPDASAPAYSILSATTSITRMPSIFTAGIKIGDSSTDIKMENADFYTKLQKISTDCCTSTDDDDAMFNIITPRERSVGINIKKSIPNVVEQMEFSAMAVERNLTTIQRRRSPIRRQVSTMVQRQESPMRDNQESPRQEQMSAMIFGQESPKRKLRPTMIPKRESPKSRKDSTIIHRQEMTIQSQGSTEIQKQESLIQKSTSVQKQEYSNRRQRSTASQRQGSPIQKQDSTVIQKQVSPIRGHGSTATQRQESPRRRHDSPIIQTREPPRQRQESPQKQESPRRRHESPIIQTQESPRKRQESPKQKQESPRQRQESPKQKQESPRRRHESPIQKQESPRRRNESPIIQTREPSRQRQESPIQKQGSPRRRHDSPIIQTQESPKQRQESPRQRQESPKQRHESPRQRQESPIQRHESPRRRQGSPIAQRQELPRQEQELPRQEQELPRQEQELPRQEQELPRQEQELPRQEQETTIIQKQISAVIQEPEQILAQEPEPNRTKTLSPFHTVYYHTETKSLKSIPSTMKTEDSSSEFCGSFASSPKRILSTANCSETNLQFVPSINKDVGVSKKLTKYVRPKLCCGGVQVHSYRDKQSSEDVMYQGEWQNPRPKVLTKRKIYNPVTVKRIADMALKKKTSLHEKVSEKGLVQKITKIPHKLSPTRKVEPTTKLNVEKKKCSLIPRCVAKAKKPIRNVNKVPSKLTMGAATSKTTLKNKNITKSAYVVKKPQICVSSAREVLKTTETLNKTCLPYYLRRHALKPPTKDANNLNLSIDSAKINKNNTQKSIVPAKTNNFKQDFLKFQNIVPRQNFTVLRNEVEKTSSANDGQSAKATPESGRRRGAPKRPQSPQSQNSSTCSSPNSIATVRAVSIRTKNVTNRRHSTSSYKASTANSGSENTTPNRNKKFTKRSKSAKVSDEKAFDNKENVPQTSRQSNITSNASDKITKGAFLGQKKGVFIAQLKENPALQSTANKKPKPNVSIPNTEIDIKKSTILNFSKNTFKSDDWTATNNNTMSASTEVSNMVLVIEPQGAQHEPDTPASNIVNTRLITEWMDNSCIGVNENQTDSIRAAMRMLIEETLDFINEPRTNCSIDSETVILSRENLSGAIVDLCESPISFKTVIMNEDNSLQSDLEHALNRSFDTTFGYDSVHSLSDTRLTITDFDILSFKSITPVSKHSDYFSADSLELQLNSPIQRIHATSVKDIYERKDQPYNPIPQNNAGVIAVQAFSGFSIDSGPMVVGDMPDPISFIDSETGSMADDVFRQANSEELFISGRSSNSFESCLLDDDVVPSWLFRIISQQQTTEVEVNPPQPLIIPLPMPDEPMYDVNGNDVEGLGLSAGAGDGRGIHSDQSQDSSGRGTSLSSSATSSDAQSEAILIDPSAFVSQFDGGVVLLDDSENSSIVMVGVNDEDNELGNPQGTAPSAADARSHSHGESRRNPRAQAVVASDVDADVSSLETDVPDSS